MAKGKFYTLSFVKNTIEYLLCINSRKPQVNYATALDVFIILCFAIVFAALVEFAMLNFLDTLIRLISGFYNYQRISKLNLLIDFRRLKRKEAEAEKLISKVFNYLIIQNVASTYFYFYFRLTIL